MFTNRRVAMPFSPCMATVSFADPRLGQQIMLSRTVIAKAKNPWARRNEKGDAPAKDKDLDCDWHMG